LRGNFKDRAFLFYFHRAQAAKYSLAKGDAKSDSYYFWMQFGGVDFVDNAVSCMAY